MGIPIANEALTEIKQKALRTDLVLCDYDLQVPLNGLRASSHCVPLSLGEFRRS
jgi:hypothetical protein